jgi:hypothetical protein
MKRQRVGILVNWTVLSAIRSPGAFASPWHRYACDTRALSASTMLVYEYLPAHPGHESRDEACPPTQTALARARPLLDVVCSKFRWRPNDQRVHVQEGRLGPLPRSGRQEEEELVSLKARIEYASTHA